LIRYTGITVGKQGNEMNDLQKVLRRFDKAQIALARQTQKVEAARRKQGVKLVLAKMRELSVTIQDLEA
jgi:hypothetical protein